MSQVIRMLGLRSCWVFWKADWVRNVKLQYWKHSAKSSKVLHAPCLWGLLFTGCVWRARSSRVPIWIKCLAQLQTARRAPGTLKARRWLKGQARAPLTSVELAWRVETKTFGTNCYLLSYLQLRLNFILVYLYMFETEAMPHKLLGWT